MRTKRGHQDDAGIGLVEIVIAMFLLALLAVAFLPLLVDALRASVRNASIATANSLMSEQLDAASTLPRTCDAMNAWGVESVTDVIDTRGTVYSIDRIVTGCPAASYPATATVEVRVTIGLSPSTRIESTTLLIVESTS